MSKILTLPGELLISIMDNLGTVDNICKMRLVCQVFKYYCDLHAGKHLFKTLVLRLDDAAQLRRSLDLARGPLLHRYVRYLTIIGKPSMDPRETHWEFLKQLMIDTIPLVTSYANPNCIELPGDCTTFTASLSPSENTVSDIWLIVHGIFAQFVTFAGSIDDVIFQTRPRKSSVVGGNAEVWVGSLQDAVSKPLELSNIHDMTEIISDLISTVRLIHVLQPLELKLASLDLGNALIPLELLPALARIISASTGLRRLSINLFELRGILMEQDHTIESENTNCAIKLGECLGASLKELVVISSHVGDGYSASDQFLTIFLKSLTLSNLEYFHLDGFSLQYDGLFDFLARHKSSIIQHWYNDVHFEGMDDVHDRNLEQYLNEDLAKLNLPQVYVGETLS